MADNEGMEHVKIADNEVKSVATGDMVKMESFWKDQTCVIYFLRRFGCMFCRTSAKDVSALKPALDAQNVRLIGVGLEELGVEAFVEGNFFAGDLFVDLQQKCYKDLAYNRTSFLGLVPSLIGRKGRDAISKGRQEKVGGNFQGDGYQSGGIIIVTAGGEKTLFSWKQSDPTDTIDPQLLSKALNLSVEQPQEMVE